jgi:hypothetical protein
MFLCLVSDERYILGDLFSPIKIITCTYEFFAIQQKGKNADFYDFIVFFLVFTIFSKF